MMNIDRLGHVPGQPGAPVRPRGGTVDAGVPSATFLAWPFPVLMLGTTVRCTADYKANVRL